MRSCECEPPKRARYKELTGMLLFGFPGICRFPWSRTPNHHRSCTDNWPPGPARAAIVVACLLALITYITSMPARASMVAQTELCPMLLMDFECAQRLQRLEHAADREARDRIAKEYRQLLDERRKSCPMAVESEHRPRHQSGALSR